ncbi:MAG TPA: MBL fold metallo-hydrolase [Vicinamibacterales bacterium]|nr:MBL fold metallo-hydrolase [Vicinamibacterales bacterium]
MWKARGCAAAVIIVLSFASAAGADDAKAVIDAASKAMGVVGMKSITISGAAAIGNFGQSRTISFGLASTSIRNYVRTIDFTIPASHAIGITQPPAAVRGGPLPPTGTYEQMITPATPAWVQQMQIWATPWGFLVGAAANNATVKSQKIDGVQYKAVTWSPAQKSPSGLPYKLTGYIDSDNLVVRVETWVEHPLMGDLHQEFFYTGYQSFGGLMAPAKTSQKQIGMETFVAAIYHAQANPSELAKLMDGPPPPAPPPPLPPAASEKLADGVYRITGGYVSLAVEFKDHVVVLEGGQNEARGLAVIAETKRLFPAKRIKYVVCTHPHFDHSSGLPPFVAEGVTILVDDNAKFFTQASLDTPRTLAGDVMAKSKKKARVEGVIEQMELKDETRSLMLYHVDKLEHSDSMLIAYLPKEKILFSADFNAPPAGQPVSPSIATLMANLDRLAIDFDRHVTVHSPNPDRVLTKADLFELAKRLNQ